MFKQFRDGRNARKILQAMELANEYIMANPHLNMIDRLLTQAYDLLLDTTLPRMLHINLITAWGFTGIALKDRGRPDLADRCFKMEGLLQARFDAGDYYR
jgi:hypothetical protein